MGWRVWGGVDSAKEGIGCVLLDMEEDSADDTSEATNWAELVTGALLCAGVHFVTVFLVPPSKGYKGSEIVEVGVGVRDDLVGNGGSEDDVFQG